MSHSMASAALCTQDLAARSGALGRASGFSLVELAIALTIAAVLAAAGLRWMEQLRRHAELEYGASAAAGARTALLSFAAMHHRLPCPDLQGQGLESDCEPATSGMAATGWLPVVTLGLVDRTSQADLPRRLRYSVFRAPGADLARPALSASRDLRQSFVDALRAAVLRPVDPDGPQVVMQAQACGAPPANVAFAVFVPLAPDSRGADIGRPCFVAGAQVASEQLGSLIGALSERP